MAKKQDGFVLLAVVVIVIIFIITATAVLSLAEQEIVLSRVDADKAKAFYLAEAGLAKMQEKLQKPVVGDFNSTLEGPLEVGSYSVTLDTSKNPCYVTSTGIAGNITKKVRAQAVFLAPAFEDAIYAMNTSGTDWVFQLRGTGNPVSAGFGRENGGKDMVNGNVFIDGDAHLYEESSVNPAPAPNPWGLQGDVGATGDIGVYDSADIEGATNPNSEKPDIVDLVSMDYANNNTHNVANIFDDAGVSSGYLPNGSELRNVFVKNPGDRAAECATSAGNDYFFEPSSGFVGGTQKTAETPIDAGQDRIYYVDGDVWVHSPATYGFNMKGKVTIVATGNIHISDNVQYNDANSVLGLVSLGKYDGSGSLISGGNIFFGDPRFGTTYRVAGMMFAANDFLYNTDSVTRAAAEPTTGFTVDGNFAAMGKVSVERDWYTDGNPMAGNTVAKPAHYDTERGKWVDSETNVPLSQPQIDTIRHYQMIVNYDSRVRSPETQPPGLPRGGSKIFAGLTNWQQL